MEMIFYFNISAMIISITVLVAYYAKGRIPQKDNMVLGLLAWNILFANIIEFICILFNSFLRQNTGYYKVVFFFYYLFRFLTVVLCITYLILATETIKVLNKIYIGALLLLEMTGFVLIVGSLHFEWLISFGPQNQYFRGELLVPYYLLNFVFFFLSMLHMLRFGKCIPYIKRIAMIALMIFPVMAVAVQYFNPFINIEGFGFSIGLLWLFLCMPKNDHMYDATLCVLNQHAFEQKVTIALKNKAVFDVIIINLKNKGYIQEQYGMECYATVLTQVIKACKNLWKQEEIFYLSDARFAVFTYQKNDAEHSAYADRILKYIEVDLSEEKNMPLRASCALLKSQRDFLWINDIYSYFEYMDLNGVMTDGRVNLGCDMDISYAKRVEKIEHAIDRALQKTSFEVYYQPIYGIKEGRIMAAEALLRMVDEDLGIISPDEFIPIAEKNGSILKIGEIVLNNVCEFIKRVPVREYGIQYIEVNLSAVESMAPDLSDRIDQILDAYDMDRSYINLEITETALANDTKLLAEHMYKLTKNGLSFSLDDYGTGYANINYILNLPFQIVKIDKTLLWQSINNDKAVIALNASMNMIHDMGMKIVVEGVENDEMLELLSKMNCDYLQGFYYSKPLQENAFIEYMKKQA